MKKKIRRSSARSNEGQQRDSGRRSGSAAKASKVEESFPSVAQFVQGSGWIEIGDQQGIGFVARALDYGGLVFESTRVSTLGQALAALERGLKRID